MALTSRIGVEVELLAPPGCDRQTLATAIAERCGGHVVRSSQTDSEPSLVPGMGHFWHLTPAFTVHDTTGAQVVTLVDDITLTADLAAERGRQGAPSRLVPAARSEDLAATSWYRILCDEPRLLRLVDDHSDPGAPFAEALDRAAVLFGTAVETIGGARRLRDAAGATIALAAPVAPGRERPCEVITPPLVRDHATALEALLAPARDLGFTIPVEAAVHLHLDAGPFRSVSAFTNLVRLFGHWREHLRLALGTNPACTRLQALPEDLLVLADTAGAAAVGAAGGAAGGTEDAEGWSRCQRAAAATGITKYFDINLTALLVDAPHRDTVEVRILPGALHAEDITTRAALVEALLARCLDPRPVPRPTTDPARDPARAVQELQVLTPSGCGERRAGAAGAGSMARMTGARGEA